MLTHEAWVNGGWHESWFDARPPHQPHARYQPLLSREESATTAVGISHLWPKAPAILLCALSVLDELCVEMIRSHTHRPSALRRLPGTQRMTAASMRAAALSTTAHNLISGAVPPQSGPAAFGSLAWR